MKQFKVVLGAMAALAMSAVLASGAVAGPFADFERALAAAYIPYKAALFQTNQKDKAGTEKSLEAFTAQWGQLMKSYRASPPPQYADDTGWAATVGAIDEMIAAAKVEVAKGDLAKAHDVLEGVRDKLGQMRTRNGVIVYSDRVDTYHEHMEHVLAGKYPGAEGMAKLREDAAVLAYLAELLEKHQPAALKGEAGFKDGLAAMVGAAKALQAAARSGEPEATAKAMKALKPAYAKFFVRFG